MANAYKYSQCNGTSSTGTYATLYTTPAATEAVISSIVVSNRSSSDVTVRIGTDTTAGTPLDEEFIVYDAVVAGNDTIALTLGVCLDAEKYLRVSSSASTVGFSAFLSEIS
jgi:hypothetical protein